MDVVQWNNYGVRYGDVQALKEVSCALQQGSMVALVGPNGAGKSTLMRSLLALHQGNLKEGTSQHTGEVLLWNEAPERAVSTRVGYVPQVKGFDRSFPALALEVVVSGIRGTWPFKITPQEQRLATAQLELMGIGHLAHKRVGRLSGGELQRVYLARSLVRSPELLLLDEPATGIDAKSEADLYHTLEGYRKQHPSVTILMITHDWEAAAHHASHVLVLNRSVVGYGTPAQMLTHEVLAHAFGHLGHNHHAPRIGAH